MAASRRWRAYAALALGVACISWSAMFTRWTGLPGAASAFWRMAIAAALFVPMRALAARRLAVPGRRTIAVSALAGVFFAGDLAFYNTAIMHTTAANATLLGNSAPFFVATGAWLLFGERPRAVYWGGLALAALGSVTIIGMDLLRHPQLGAGDLMAVASGACYAAYFLTIGHGRPGTDTVTANAIGAIASVLVLLPVSLAMGAPLAGYRAETWLWLAALGIVCQVGGYLCIAYALGHLPATVTSASLLTQAPLTALLAIPLLGEHLAPWQLAGGLMVLLGVWIVNRAPHAAVTTEVTTEWAVEERA